MNQDFLVVCPAFNEEGRIKRVLESILTITKNVVVIDDGSVDNTLQEVNEVGVKVIVHRRNQGKGAAIRTGIQYFLTTKMKYIVFIDADGQHNPKRIPDFISSIIKTKSDFVVGTRFRDPTWKKLMPFTRILSNLLSRCGLWILFRGLLIEDPQNGYRAFNRKTAQLMNFQTNGYEAETEMLILAHFRKLSIGFVPIESIYHIGKSTSKFSIIYDTWTIPQIMLKMFFKRNRWIANNLPLTQSYPLLKSIN